MRPVYVMPKKSCRPRLLVSHFAVVIHTLIYNSKAKTNVLVFIVSSIFLAYFTTVVKISCKYFYGIIAKI